MKKAAALGVVMLLVAALMALTLPAGADGNYDCQEYPQKCETTTTYATTTSLETTTTPTTAQETTTTTEQVTTTTAQETTTTQQTTTTVEQTTTTTVPCAPGQIHQPPFCVDPTTTTVPVFDTTTTVAVTVPEELPRTGVSAQVLALLMSVTMASGLVVLGLSRREA